MARHQKETVRTQTHAWNPTPAPLPGVLESGPNKVSTRAAVVFHNIESHMLLHQVLAEGKPFREDLGVEERVACDWAFDKAITPYWTPQSQSFHSLSFLRLNSSPRRSQGQEATPGACSQLSLRRPQPGRASIQQSSSH